MATNFTNTTAALNTATQATDRISALKSTLQSNKATEAVDSVENKLDDFSSTMNDPIGAVMKKVIFKINNVSVKVDEKINKLAEDAVKNSDSKGRVELIGSTIVITVQPTEVNRAQVIQSNIMHNIESINKNLSLLRSTVNTLTAISKTMNAIMIALDIQEMLMSLNPVTKASMLVVKKLFKILTLRDTLKEHAKTLASELGRSKSNLDTLANRFRNLNVQIKISSEANKGNNISDVEAAKNIANDLLSTNIHTEKLYEQYRNIKNKDYILTVEKYGEDQNIGKAKDAFSGLLAAETAPSYFSTGDQLLEELKNILDTED